MLKRIILISTLLLAALVFPALATVSQESFNMPNVFDGKVILEPTQISDIYTLGPYIAGMSLKSPQYVIIGNKLNKAFNIKGYKLQSLKTKQFAVIQGGGMVESHEFKMVSLNPASNSYRVHKMAFKGDFFDKTNDTAQLYDPQGILVSECKLNPKYL